MYQEWLEECNVTISPKPPSAGRCDRDRLDKFMRARRAEQYADPMPATVIKIPVDPGFGDGADLEFAREIFQISSVWESLWSNLDLHLSVVTYPTDTLADILNRWEAVIEWAKTADIPDVRILPQLHVLLYGHKLGV